MLNEHQSVLSTAIGQWVPVWLSEVWSLVAGLSKSTLWSEYPFKQDFHRIKVYHVYFYIETELVLYCLSDAFSLFMCIVSLDQCLSLVKEKLWCLFHRLLDKINMCCLPVCESGICMSSIACSQICVAARKTGVESI